MTDIDVYQPAQPGIIMTKEQAKALDDQVRQCTKAVLREGTDYGHIPGTGGEEKSLWRPGAQKLLQWFRLGCEVSRLEIDLDDDGHRQGIYYRAVVTRRHPDGTGETLATCEGYAGYDEDKFYQTAEDRQRKAEDAERRFAHIDKRPPRPDRWQNLGEYRAPWNAVIKRAQKRAIVGAVVDATAAGGLFNTDREEDDHAPEPVTGDGPTWYEQALEAALEFTDQDTGRQLYRDATQAHRDGRCTRRQQDHIQNRITQRARLLKNTVSVEVEDLGQRAPERPAGTVPDETPASGPAAPAGPDPGWSAPEGTTEDTPGTASDDQLTSLHITFGGLGFGGSDDDKQRKLKLAETITGRDLGGTSKNLSFTEARKLTDTLEGFGGDYEKLRDYMDRREQDGDGDG